MNTTRLFWLKKLLACNPFYLASAALLLYGIHRISLDPLFLAREASQLEFNFSSLQLYELLLVATAIFLARRQVWYDCTLLVFLENLLVFVPFILISRALFLEVDRGEAIWICSIGAALAVARFGGLRRFIAALNFPALLLGAGVTVLVLNIALPFAFKSVLLSHRDDLPHVQHWIWVATLPLLAIQANLLPRPRHWGGLAPQRSWLPLVMFAFWIVASGVHLWCLGYIYDLPLQLYFLSPTLWVASWTLFNRRTDLVPIPEPYFQTSLLVMPAVATLLATTYRDSSIFFTLTSLNVALYGARCLRDRSNRVAFHLLLVSVAVLIASVPQAMLPHVICRTTLVKLAAGCYVMLTALISRSPLAGMLGAGGALAAINLAFDQSHLGFECGLVFLLLHSTRWGIGQPIVNIAQALAAGAWVAHAAAWVHRDGLDAAAPAAILATVSLARCWIDERLLHRKANPIIVTSSVLVLLSIPGNFAGYRARRAHAGLLAVIMSFVLFAAGTLLALTRSKWNQR